MLPYIYGFAHQLFSHNSFMIDLFMHSFILQRASRFWQKHAQLLSSPLPPHDVRRPIACSIYFTSLWLFSNNEIITKNKNFFRAPRSNKFQLNISGTLYTCNVVKQVTFYQMFGYFCLYTSCYYSWLHKFIFIKL